MPPQGDAHSFTLRQGLLVLRVCVGWECDLCVAMFVGASEDGCSPSIIGLCFNNVHTYLHISNYRMCIEKQQWDHDIMCLQVVCVYMLSPCVCV